MYHAALRVLTAIEKAGRINNLDRHTGVLKTGPADESALATGAPRRTRDKDHFQFLTAGATASIDCSAEFCATIRSSLFKTLNEL